MSETRPPMTAGPIERALRFLKSTSVSCTGEGEADGCAVAAAVDCGVADGEAAAAGDGDAIGANSSSWPNKSPAKEIRQQSVIRAERNPAVVGIRLLL